MTKNLKTTSNLLFIAILLFSAINTRSEQKSSSIEAIFAHGIADTHKQAYRYSIKEVLTKPFLTFDFPDATESFIRVKRQHTSLAQDNEIARLDEIYQKACAINKTGKIILFGLSRGASTILNFTATHQPKQVLALILESPFDCVESIIINKLKQFRMPVNDRTIAWGQKVMSFLFSHYNPQGIHPVDVLDTIDKNIPIFIVCSKQDKLVPCTSSANIYKKFVESGHKKVHFLIVDSGNHSKILWDAQEEVYRHCTHAFYKKYNLPYNAEYADLGEPIIETTQPDLQTLTTYIS